MADWTQGEKVEDGNSSKRFPSRSYGWSSNSQPEQRSTKDMLPLSVAHVQRETGNIERGRAFDLYLYLVYRYVYRPTSRQSSDTGCLLKLSEDSNGQTDMVSSVQGLHPVGPAHSIQCPSVHKEQTVYRLYRLRAVVVTIGHRRTSSIRP